MGYIEETGAAQHYRDARIAPIYEGTNGIQAIDLVTRKLPLAGGATVQGLYRRAQAHGRGGQCHQRSGIRLRPACGCSDAVDACDARPRLAARRPAQRSRRGAGGRDALPAAVRTAAGGALLAEEALAAKRLAGNGADAAARIAIARFFAENLAVQAGGLERTVVEGADSVNRADAALA